MKKLLLIVCVISQTMLFSACTKAPAETTGGESAAVSETPAAEASEDSGRSAELQTILSVNAKEAEAVEEILGSLGIDWDTIEVQPFELTDDEELNELESMYRDEVTPYDIVAKNGKRYMMSINTSDNTVSSVADSELKEQIYNGEE